MYRSTWGLMLLLLCAPGPLRSDLQSQVVEGPQGPVEFLALESWNARTLFDSIQAVAPDRPFHACAVVMKRQIGFADAAAMGFFTDNPGEVYTVVVGIEDSVGVNYRSAGDTQIDVSGRWVVLLELIEGGVGHITGAARSLHLRTADVDSAVAVADRWGAPEGAVHGDWVKLRTVDTPEDLVTATRVLTHDPSWQKRTVAVAVLANFIESDEAWHLIIEAFRDPDGRVTSTAEAVARAFLEQEDRAVDWSDAAESLTWIFAGTNPFAFRTVLSLLVHGEVDADLGPRIVRQNPNLLLAYAAAGEPQTREAAVRFLRHISGLDFTQPGDWRRWVRGL